MRLATDSKNTRVADYIRQIVEDHVDSDPTGLALSPNPPNGVVGVAEREIRDMEERLSGRFWTVGAGERLATVMWSSPARDRTSRRRSLAGLARVLGDVGVAGG